MDARVGSSRPDTDEGLWTPPPGESGGREPDQGEQIWNLLEVIQRRWMIILPAIIIVFALNFVGTALSAKRYTATALILINPGREQVIDDDQLVTDNYPSEVVVESEREVIGSPQIMRRVVDALRLDEDPEWNGTLTPPGPIETAIAALTGRAPAPTEDLSADDREALREWIARALLQSVTVTRREPSYALQISATSLNPDRAADIANGVASAYLEAQTESQFSATQRANVWLSGRVAELASDVQAKERAAEEFRIREGLSVAAGGEDSGQGGDVQAMLAAARADLTEKEARLRQVERLVREGGSADLIAGAANSQLITTLRTTEAGMQQRQTELEERYGELHPEVQSGRAELAEMRRRIDAEIARIITGLRNEAEIARQRFISLQGNFGSETGGLESGSDAVIQYRQLLREAQAARSVHQSFLLRFQEVEGQAALPVTTARLVSSAAPPGGPSSPNLSAAFRMALLVSLVVGIGLGFLVEFLDGSIARASDVERRLGVPAVATVPKLKRSEYRTLAPGQQHPAGFLVEKPMSAFAETFRVLRTSIVHARIDHPVRVVAVTSALPDEGKTTLSLCLARIAALAGQRVALIDCDLRRQALAKLLDATPKRGLLEVLTEKAAWRDVIEEDDETSVKLLMGTPTIFTPLDLFSSQAMAELIGELRSSFDLIILDCAPVLQVADTRTAAALADLTMVVMRAGKTPIAAARTSIRALREAGASVHGIALNFVEPPRVGRGAYYNSLYYGRSSAKYYQG